MKQILEINGKITTENRIGILEKLADLVDFLPWRKGENQQDYLFNALCSIKHKIKAIYRSSYHTISVELKDGSFIAILWHTITRELTFRLHRIENDTLTKSKTYLYFGYIKKML